MFNIDPVLFNVFGGLFRDGTFVELSLDGGIFMGVFSTPSRARFCAGGSPMWLIGAIGVFPRGLIDLLKQISFDATHRLLELPVDIGGRSFAIR